MPQAIRTYASQLNANGERARIFNIIVKSYYDLMLHFYTNYDASAEMGNDQLLIDVNQMLSP